MIITCPGCRTAIDAPVKPLDPPRPPKHGSWFVCSECGSVSRFTAPRGNTIQGLSLRPATLVEFISMPAGERAFICAIRKSILDVRRA